MIKSGDYVEAAHILIIRKLAWKDIEKNLDNKYRTVLKSSSLDYLFEDEKARYSYMMKSHRCLWEGIKSDGSLCMYWEKKEKR